ncbi:MAG: hypothetical protein LBU26_06775 [Synergistaceae bacterium]|jgi:hypothetical protein|nr:hypothetical protein [Synergistaceae bacterium]
MLKKILAFALFALCCVSPAFAASEAIIDGLEGKITKIYENRDNLKEEFYSVSYDELRKEMIYQGPGMLFRFTGFFSMAGEEKNWKWRWIVSRYATTEFGGLIEGIKPGMSQREVGKILSGLREHLGGSDNPANPEEVTYFGERSSLTFFYKNNKAFCIDFSVLDGYGYSDQDLEENTQKQFNELRKSAFGTR